MQYKIVADSSSDVLNLSEVPFASVPLKITAAGRTYVDDETLDVAGMVADIRACKEKTVTACPAPADWMKAFGDAERVFCVTITSGLSGSCNAARLAAQDYQEKYPDRRVYVVDSLSAGPELRLMIEKLEKLILAGHDFDTIVQEIEAYRKRTFLLFTLQSLHNFVVNGRVSPALGTLVGLLGIRIVGRASEKGDLQPLDKCRGDRKALQSLMNHLKELGYRGGRLCIDHCQNEGFAHTLRDAILKVFPNAAISIGLTRGLCSYYAEEGGVLMGFEAI